MRRSFLHLSIIFFLLFGIPLKTFCAEYLEPVVLENRVTQEDTYAEPDTSGESDLWEVLTQIDENKYNSEYTDINKINYLLEGKLTKEFGKESFIKDAHLWGAYNGDWGMIFKDGGSVQNHYEFNALSLGSDWRFKDNAADARFMLNFQPLSGRTFIRNTISDVYIGTNKIPHHRVQIGHFRPAIGMEGKRSAYLLPFLYRSQISRNFGSVRKIGGKIMGDYNLVEYDLGIYSTDTYLKSFFPGVEFSGWINFKPLGKTDGRYGELKIGGGLEKGHLRSDYCVVGAYAGYEYKRISADFEWANADGYNGALGHSTHHANGLYTTLGYKITPKLQAIARYDEFDSNKNVVHNDKRQYWAGINYFVKGQALRFMINYIFCQNEAERNSHKIMVGTQILL